MKLTITIPDDIAERVWRRPDRDEFVSRAVAEALERQPDVPTRSRTGRSRWARLVEDIGSRATATDSEFLKQQRKEFREGFRFEHDER